MGVFKHKILVIFVNIIIIIFKNGAVNSVINNIINELCQKFNVAASDLVPRLQAYGMAMSLYGAIAAGAFCVAILIAAIIIIRNYCDDDLLGFGIVLTCIVETIPIFVMLYNIYTDIGWKYAPEVKSIEYIMYLFKN